MSRSDSLTLEIRGEEPEHFDVQGCRLDYELAEMERIISCGDREAFERHLEHSLLVARLLEEARESAGITFACDMEEAE